MMAPPKMEELRLGLLKDKDPKKIEGLIWELKDDDVYDEFCEFLDKCEVLRIEIADSVRQFMVDYILKHRRDYIPPAREEDELSIEGRMELVKEILEENLKVFSDPVEEKKIHLLMFLARIMNELRFPEKREKKKRSKEIKIGKEQESKENEQKEKKESVGNVWEKLRFLLCVFVAIKSDDKHTKYPIIDFYFQLLVDEEIILNLLKKLLEVLKNGSGFEEWTALETVYKPTRSFYKMRKICIHLDHIESIIFGDYSENEMILFRHFQQIGESLTVIERLGIKKIRKSWPMEKTDFWSLTETSNNILFMRNQLSHAKAQQAIFDLEKKLKIVFSKMYVFIFDMIKEEQMSILDTFISKWIAETDNNKLETKIVRINTERINNWDSKNRDDQMRWFPEIVKTLIRSVPLKSYYPVPELFKAIDEEHLTILNLEQFNASIIQFFSNLKSAGADDLKIKLKYLKDNKKHLTRSQIRNLMSVLFQTLPENGQTIWTERESFEITVKKNESKIEFVLEIILNAIENVKEKKKFKELKDNLLFKRHLHQIFKTIGDCQYINDNWPSNDVCAINKYEDPLNCIVKKTKELLPDFRVVECFLNLLARRRIIFVKNKMEIVEKVKQMEEIRLRNRLQSIKRELEDNKSNQIAKEMAVLDGFEVLKFLGKEFKVQKNYMDFDCILPTGRALRNYLAHGDIYLDLFLTQEDRHTILDQQLAEIFNEQVNHPVPRKVYKSYLKERFNLVQTWIETFIVPLKLSTDLRHPSGKVKSKEDFAVAMRARDLQGRSYVHHNLEKCDQNNAFFMYLVQFFENENLRKSCETLGEVNEYLLDSKRGNQNEIYDKMIEESKSPKEPFPCSVNYLEDGSTLRDKYIDDFLNETNIVKKQILLCKIVSIKCPKLEVFQQVFRGVEEHYSSFLKLACLYNEPEIVKYIFDRYGIEEESVLDVSLRNAVERNNFQLAEYLIKKGSYVYRDIILTAFKSPKFEMIQLLLQYHEQLNFSQLFSLSLSFIWFSEPNICEYLVEKYPELVKYHHCRLLFFACLWKRERLLKFLVEKGANVNAVYGGISVLSAAVHFIGDLEVVKYLVEKGANVNPNTKSTSLMNACEEGKVEIGKYLIENGADLSVQNETASPLNKAIGGQSIELSDEFFKRGFKIDEDLVDLAIPYITPEFFLYLVQKDNNINWVIKSFKSLTMSNNIDLCKAMLNYLKDKRFYLNYRHFFSSLTNDYFWNIYLKYPYHELTEKDWSNLLLLSAHYRDFDKMRVIISKGANIKHTHVDYGNCLHYLFSNDMYFDNGVLRYLLINGADFTTKDKDQLTPIQIAARKLDKHSFQGVLKIILETRDVKIKIQFPINEHC